MWIGPASPAHADGRRGQHGGHGVRRPGCHHDRPGQERGHLPAVRRHAVTAHGAGAGALGRDVDPDQPALGHHRPRRRRDPFDPDAPAGGGQAVEQGLPAPVQVLHVALGGHLHLERHQVGRGGVEVGDVGRGAGEHLDDLALVAHQPEVVEPGRRRPVGQLVGPPARHPRQDAGQARQPLARHEPAAGQRDRSERQPVDDVAPPAHAPRSGGRAPVIDTPNLARTGRPAPLR